MITKLDRTGSVEQFNALLNQVAALDEVQSVLVMTCDANGFTPAMLDETLRSVEVPVFGGIFPEIIYGEDKLDHGTVIAGLSTAACVRTVPNLSDGGVDYEDYLDNELAQFPGKTMLVFVDGLAKRISALVESLFNVFGLELNYLGGGAGSLSFEQKPCILTNAGLLADCAVLANIEIQSGVGVSHGWSDVAGPIMVTESDRNVIQTLDWKPAFEIYRDIIREHSGSEILPDNFFDVAKSYPFGITKLGAEKVVRDPLLVQEDGSLVCVGEVPQGCYVHIMTGDPNSLVTAAGKALTLSEQSLGEHSVPRTTLFIDCVSRSLFLGDEFSRELNAVHQPNSPLIGALTLGEIANSRRDYLEFYNKTSVVGVLEV